MSLPQNKCKTRELGIPLETIFGIPYRFFSKLNKKNNRVGKTALYRLSYTRFVFNSLDIFCKYYKMAVRLFNMCV